MPSCCDNEGLSTFLDNATPCCTILNTINDGVFIVDNDLRITSFFNQAACKITGFDADEAIGKSCHQVFRADICGKSCPLKQTLETGRPIRDVTAKIRDRRDRIVPVSLSTTALRDENGRITGAVEIFRDLSMLEILRHEIEGGFRAGDMVSKNSRMREIFEILPDIAQSDSTVLLQGESGTGKGLMTAAIHEMSSRNNKPFIKINCGAVPETLLESELFGHVRGAFTGAEKDKPGKFALADKGTLFLDEIGDTSPALQVKLLKVIEEQEFCPVGGVSPVRVNVRIIAAGNRELADMVAAGEFRNDLFYRLNIIRIDLPPLRKRREDIPLLADHFLRKFCSLKNRHISGLSERVWEILMNYRYPGNIRELENIMEHAVVLCREFQIETRHLPRRLLENSESRPVSMFNPVEDAEFGLLRDTLKQFGGNRKRVAESLAISRATLWRRMKKYGLL